jgi:Na+-driven multidrug efflux pump
VRFDASHFRLTRPVVSRMLRIGIPPGGEFALMFVFIAIVYYVIRDFGPAAQAGYGIASRIMQAIFLPAMAVAFSASPVAGQNVGAGQYDRVRDVLRWALILGSACMVGVTLISKAAPETLVGLFAKEPEAIAVGADFLRFISWNFVFSGVIFTCSGMFQALGNTLPSLASSGLRLLTFALPVLWLRTQPGFTMHGVWVLSVGTTIAQAALSYLLLRRVLTRRLAAPSARPLIATA